jgi:hypothetical protein
MLWARAAFSGGNCRHCITMTGARAKYPPRFTGAARLSGLFTGIRTCPAKMKDALDSECSAQ